MPTYALTWCTGGWSSGNGWIMWHPYPGGFPLLGEEEQGMLERSVVGYTGNGESVDTGM